MGVRLRFSTSTFPSPTPASVSTCLRVPITMSNAFLCYCLYCLQVYLCPVARSNFTPPVLTESEEDERPLFITFAFLLSDYYVLQLLQS
jgi:hypothetical protein